MRNSFGQGKVDLGIIDRYRGHETKFKRIHQDALARFFLRKKIYKHFLKSFFLFFFK